jgi:germination protein YpeB
MKKNKKNKIGRNFSSGAEKVEEIAKNTPTAGVNSTVGGGFAYNGAMNSGLNGDGNGAMNGMENPVPYVAFNDLNENGTNDGQGSNAQPKSEEKIILERESKKVRMLHEKRKERERRAEKEKRKAEREKDAAARRVSEAMRKQERKESMERRKAEEKHLAEQRREERAKVRAERKNKNGNGNGNKNNERSGWIAAVAVLGAVTLGLGAVVTVGAVEMKETKQGIVGAYRGNLYELTELIENVDGDLDRIRVSASEEQQARILTDLLVQTRLAEGVLEKLPIPPEADGNVTSFLNKTAFESERLLRKLRKGERLSQEDERELERLYRVNHEVKGLLSVLLGKLQDEDVLEYLKGEGEDMMTEAIRGIENATIEENRSPSFATPPEVRTGAAPKDDKSQKLSSSEAEGLVREYFSDYKIKEIEFQGETTTRRMEAYNFMLTDENDLTLFAQVSERDGKLISFDYYEHCIEHNFDLENAKTIAENFLAKMGMENMTAVKVGQMGATASFTFAYELDGAVFYPDSVEVKVCEQKGVVVGYNAAGYLKNHRQRTPLTPALSMSEAAAKLHEKLTLSGSKLALVRAGKEEKPAYEFICEYKDQTYFVYIDANTGEEISILNANDLIR